VKAILASVDFAGHELPAYYLGDPNKDLALLAEAEAAALQLDAPDLRRGALEVVRQEMARISAYLSSRRE
jgi:hypothetical protein